MLSVTVATSALRSAWMALSWALIEAISSLSRSLFLMAVLISAIRALASVEVSFKLLSKDLMVFRSSTFSERAEVDTGSWMSNRAFPLLLDYWF